MSDDGTYMIRDFTEEEEDEFRGYNLDVLKIRARKRLHHWYHLRDAIPVGGQGVPDYRNVPEGAFVLKKAPRCCTTNIAIAINLLTLLGATLTIDPETHALNGVLRDGTRIGPTGEIPRV